MAASVPRWWLVAMVIVAAILLVAPLRVDNAVMHRQTALCRVADLAVARVQDDVEVVNRGPSPCAFAGRFPVELHTRLLVGAPPPAARGTLAPGQRYLQPYLYRAAIPCPSGGPQLSTAPGTGRITVQVENTPVAVRVSSHEAYTITHCILYAAGPPRITS